MHDTICCSCNEYLGSWIFWIPASAGMEFIYYDKLSHTVEKRYPEVIVELKQEYYKLNRFVIVITNLNLSGCGNPY
ncbi:MAG TPA: hypothetical protein G4O15_08765 [Dehalococcoidia bacterium]|nr:hypothetical protein [Dehalococcoidia bacterium]